MKTLALQNDLAYTGYESLVEQAAQDRHKLCLLIGRVHCAACIQKIESALNKMPGVIYARLNFSTHRLIIEWIGQPSQADEFTRAIIECGYDVKPFDPHVAQLQNEDEHRFLLLCLGVAGFAMGNIMLISVGLWTTNAETMGSATRELLHWLSALIGIPAVLFSGRPFFSSAISVLKQGHTNMDVPISVALILASVMSLHEIIHGGEHAYFDSAIMLMFFLLIGRYLDFRARRQARSAAIDLMQKLSGFANVIQDGKILKTLIKDLREGMIVSVAAGENIPADGRVVQGQSLIDTSLVTGETLPRSVNIGVEVYGGTLNIDAPLLVCVSKAVDDSLIADIMRLMEKASQSQAKYVRLADRLAQLYTPVVHVLAALGFIIWFFVIGESWQFSLMISVAVLIITCPCALGLAVPVVQVLASGHLMKKGILVKSGDALERLAQIDTVLMDKTGTLTIGRPKLIGHSDQKNLQLPASLAQYSRHPLSQALVEAYKGEMLKIDEIKEYPGLGLEGLYKGRKLRLGSRAWCGDINAPQNEFLEIWYSYAEPPPVVFLLNDVLRFDSAETIKKLKQKNLNVVLLSGDRDTVVQNIANICEIKEAYGDLNPLQKYEYLERLSHLGHKVMMVGDGVNDTPVLAGAHVSMAPGTAIDMAQKTADIIFMGTGFKPVDIAHNAAIYSQRLIKQNFAIALLYNLVAIPLAFCGFVTPFVAALAMSVSSLLVIANSFRLRRLA